MLTGSFGIRHRPGSFTNLPAPLPDRILTPEPRSKSFGFTTTKSEAVIGKRSPPKDWNGHSMKCDCWLGKWHDSKRATASKSTARLFLLERQQKPRVRQINPMLNTALVICYTPQSWKGSLKKPPLWPTPARCRRGHIRINLISPDQAWLPSRRR